MGKLVKIAKTGIVSLSMLATLALVGFSLPIAGQRSLSVQSGSMEPKISKGDVVRVKRTPPANLNVGDVITFINPTDKRLSITHRISNIVEVQGGNRQFITKGDANASQDPTPVPESMVIGKVEQTIPFLGFGLDFIKTIPGLILIVYIPALLLIISETKRLIAYYRKIKPYIDPIFANRLKMGKQGSISPLSVAIIGILIAGAIIAVPTWATQQDSAQLSGNTITVASEDDEDNENEENVDVDIDCNSDEDININTSVRQRRQTGDAVNDGNNDGGSATSGDASNHSSTSINVDINNGECEEQ